MRIKKFIIALMVLVFSITCAGTALAGDSFPEQEAEKSIGKALQYLESIQNKDGGFPAREDMESSTSVTNWVIMALAAAGEDVTGKRWSVSGNNPVDFIMNSEKSPEEVTDYARLLLAMSAAGQGAEYKGSDLVEKISSFQGENGHFGDLVNSHMWSVLALYSAGREIPQKEKAKEWLLQQQNEDGGFGWAPGAASDVDDTAVALQALAALGVDPQGSAAVQEALDYMKEYRQDNGGFSSGEMSGKANSATDAWAIQGLIAAGANPAGSEWSVNGQNPVTHLLDLQSEEGFFYWTPGTKSSAAKMTVYAVMALSQETLPVNAGSSFDSDESSAPGKFSDLSRSYWAYEPIMELVGENVLGGYPEGTFKPENHVKRSEFTKFIVYGLGLQGTESSAAEKFNDVDRGDWYFDVVSIAVEKGLVNGRTEDSFAPSGKITSGELAAMLVRALPPEEKGEVEEGPKWYSGAVQQAEQNNLLYPDFDPDQPATRAQCSYSIVQLRNVTGVK